MLVQFTGAMEALLVQFTGAMEALLVVYWGHGGLASTWVHGGLASTLYWGHLVLLVHFTGPMEVLLVQFMGGEFLGWTGGVQGRLSERWQNVIGLVPGSQPFLVILWLTVSVINPITLAGPAPMPAATLEVVVGEDVQLIQQI